VPCLPRSGLELAQQALLTLLLLLYFLIDARTPEFQFVSTT
jgi:hypothetical protein